MNTNYPNILYFIDLHTLLCAAKKKKEEKHGPSEFNALYLQKYIDECAKFIQIQLENDPIQKHNIANIENHIQLMKVKHKYIHKDLKRPTFLAFSVLADLIRGIAKSGILKLDLTKF